MARTKLERYEAEGAGRLELWAGMIGPAFAFLLNLQLNYMLVPVACRSTGEWVLHLAHLATLLLCLGSGVPAWRHWTVTGRQIPGEGAGPIPRSQFMAAVGLLTTALFATIILAQWLSVFFLDPCQ